jgi:hypothetical protein
MYSVFHNYKQGHMQPHHRQEIKPCQQPRFHVFPFSVTQPVPHSLSNYYTVFMLITAWMQNIYSNQFGNRTLKALMLPTLTGIVLFVILYNVVFFPHHYVHKMHSSCLLMLILKYLKQ